MADTCPECGAEFGPHAQSPRAHMNEHWAGVPRREMSKEARERQDQLSKMAAAYPPDDLGEEI